MKLSPLIHIKVFAVLAAAGVMLGCEAPSTKAGEQTPPVHNVAAEAARPELVTVTDVGGVANAPHAEGAEIGAEPLAQFDPANEAPVSAEPVTLSEQLQEVVKLAESGVGDEVILAFVHNSPIPFNPTPEEIVYLTDIGLSDVIITALVNHRGTQVQIAQQPGPAVAEAPVAQPQPAPAPEATYNPEPQVVYSSPPVVQYVTPAPAVEYSYFYSSLAPYGSWVDVAGYGWCWQPRAAVIYHDWRPYSHRGRWLYSDVGWYWHSDYSWGWAPFHYGRWFRHPAHGWHWKPGSVWAPAWVSWRYTDSHCGWAPLPPGSHYRSGVGFSYYGASVGASFSFGLHRDSWTFVPAHRLHDREIWRHRLRPDAHGHAYQRSKVINNYTVNNNTIINKGVDPDRVPGLKRSELRKVSVREMPAGGRNAVRPDRLHQEGSNLVVYRPKPPVAGEHSMRALESGAGRSVASTSHRSAPQATVNPGGTTPGRGNPDRDPGSRRPGANPDSAIPGVPSSRPIRALGSTGVGQNSLDQTAVPGVRARSEPSKTAVENRPSVPALETQRRETVRPSFGSPAGGVQSRPVPPASLSGNASVTPRPNPAVRAEPPKSTRPSPVAPQTVPGAGAPGASSWSQLSGSSVSANRVFERPATPAPQTVAPAPQYRQESPKPIRTVAPEKFQSAAPAQVYQPRSAPAPSASFSLPSQRPVQVYTPPAVQSRPAQPAQSFSLPSVQSRPMPSYSPPAAQAPAVQSRPAQPAQSFSLPASRPAPQSAPTPTPSRRLNNGRQ